MSLLNRNKKFNLLKELNLVYNKCRPIKSSTLDANMVVDKEGDSMLVVVIQDNYPLCNICD